jgi:exoribonuclease R
MAVPVNTKLPWFNIKQAPAEYHSDIKEGRNIKHRYYVFKFSEWTKNYKKPLCVITESIGEAGNLEAESMRLLRMHDICTEAYENENCEPTASVHECLKMFSKDIDQVSKEWIIPEEEIKKRLDLREKRIFTIDPITAKDLDDALSIE